LLTFNSVFIEMADSRRPRHHKLQQHRLPQSNQDCGREDEPVATTPSHWRSLSEQEGFATTSSYLKKTLFCQPQYPSCRGPTHWLYSSSSGSQNGAQPRSTYKLGRRLLIIGCQNILGIDQFANVLTKSAASAHPFMGLKAPKRQVSHRNYQPAPRGLLPL